MLGAEPAHIAERKQPNNTAGRSELAARILSTFVLAPLAIAAAYIGGWPFGVFWLVGAVGIWWEWNALVSGNGNRLLFVLGATALVLALVIAEGGMTRTPILIIALGALGIGVFARADRRIWAAGGLLYAGVVLMGTILLRNDPQLGFIAILFLFAVVWATDICAYFVGRALGGPKLIRKISPHKTWAGALGGTAGALLAGLSVARLAGLDDLLAIVVIAALLSVAAQAGDVFESAVKRRYGAKDSSHVIPGHGGFMDRLDGYAAAVAAAAALGVVRGGMDAAAQGLLLW
ncbi:MAG: phosphatidate cytidylyltransferase [Xanthobacteraceae bacterium]